MATIPLIRLSGKSKGVFRMTELLARFRGSVTLKELISEPDILLQERKADAYRDTQDRRQAWEGNNAI